MEKVKKFVVLPLGLFIGSLVLSLHRNPWGYLRNFRLDFWQKTGYFLLNMFASAAFILLIALLFVFVFTNRNIADLFKKPALKAMGIVFTAELIAKFFLTDVLMPLLNRNELEAAKKGIRMNEWYMVIVHGLPSIIIGFAVVYFTLRLLIKPLNLSFSFHGAAFFLVLVLYLTIPTLESYGMVQLTNLFTVSDDLTLVTIRAINLTVGLNMFNAVLTVISAVIGTMIEEFIFFFFNRCIEQNQPEAI